MDADPRLKRMALLAIGVFALVGCGRSERLSVYFVHDADPMGPGERFGQPPTHDLRTAYAMMRAESVWTARISPRLSSQPASPEKIRASLEMRPDHYSAGKAKGDRSEICFSISGERTDNLREILQAMVESVNSGYAEQGGTPVFEFEKERNPASEVKGAASRSTH